MAKQQTQPDRTPTRRQIAVSKREREQLRYFYMGLGLVGALILIVLAIGLYQTFVLEPNSPVSTVNGAAITTRDYQNRVKYERFMLDYQIKQIQQQLDALSQPGNEQLAQFLTAQYQQMADQLLQERATVDRQTVDDMVEDKLVETEAQKRGLSVSSEEVAEQINRFLAAQTGGLTTKSANETVTARAEASATAALWTPTPTFTPSPTITPTAEITQPVGTPTNTPTPAPTPTLTVIDENQLKTDYTNWLNTLSSQVGIDETTYRQIIQAGVLKQKLQKTLGDEVPKEAEQSHARHIMTETEDEAKKVVERLKKGEDFAELAKELSIDYNSGAEGGDLGWAPRGRFVKEVEDAIFSLPIHQVSDPIKSDFGWHVLEVLERGNRELSPADYSRSQRQAYTDWLSETRAAANIQDLWTVAKAPKDKNNPLAATSVPATLPPETP